MKRQPFLARGDESNAAVLDTWSLVHVATGVAAAALGMGGFTYIFASVAYEVAEYYHESPKGSWLFGSKRPEWDVNMVSDVAVGAAAYCVTAWLMGRRPPA